MALPSFERCNYLAESGRGLQAAARDVGLRVFGIGVFRGCFWVRYAGCAGGVLLSL